jgi:hypothetical protein
MPPNVKGDMMMLLRYRLSLVLGLAVAIQCVAVLAAKEGGAHSLDWTELD